ncbi:MAG: hypothetical protein ACP5SH_24055 [Syntrophobacteraceae bacterium]
MMKKRLIIGLALAVALVAGAFSSAFAGNLASDMTPANSRTPAHQAWVNK